MSRTSKSEIVEAEKRIVIGNNAMLGWNVNIRDSGGQSIYLMDDLEAHALIEPEEVRIGDLPGFTRSRRKMQEMQMAIEMLI